MTRKQPGQNQSPMAWHDNVPGAEGLVRLWALLPSARLVGGCVRDLLAGVPLHDVDLAIPLTPEAVQKHLTEAGIKVIPTGLGHGTVTAVVNGRPYEVTTLRRDLKTDGRHAVVAWTQDWKEDAARRDFTINALSMDQAGCIHDYFGGQEDLAAGRVRFVGDARQRIEEDALRILRFFRFHARYGRNGMDEDACAAIRSRKALVRHLSAERVASEMLRMLSGPAADHTVFLMKELGILWEILPEAQVEPLVRLVACGQPAHALPRLLVLGPSPAAGVAYGKKLKLSNAACSHMQALAAEEPVLHPDMDDDALRRLRANHTVEVLLDRSWLNQAVMTAALSTVWDTWRARLVALPQPVFPLSGRDGLALGITAGPEMGHWLQQGRCWWLEHGCRPDRAACLAWLKEQLSAC